MPEGGEHASNPASPCQGLYGWREDSYDSDICLMLDYCRANGIAVRTEPASAIAAFLSRDRRAVPAEPARSAALHEQLSALIAPATPRTLAATTYSRHPLRIGAALILLGLLVSGALMGIGGYIATVPLATGGLVAWGVQVNYLCAALLGAALSGLWTAYPYFRKRTFDPRFLLAYGMRLMIGVVSGMVLANLGSGVFGSVDIVANLGTGMFGLLGGYSAEAVRQILDRLVEILVTAVRGEDKGRVDAQRVTISRDILDISQSASADPNTPADVRIKLERLLKKLREG